MNQDSDTPVSSPPEDNGPIDDLLVIPFEDPSKDFFTGLIETMKLVLLQPQNFFRNYNLGGAITKSLTFAVVIGWAAGIVGLIWEKLIGAAFSESIMNIIRDRMPDAQDMDWDKFGGGGGGFGILAAAILIPVVLAVGLFIAAGIYHLGLMIFKGANKSFETTFNVVAYSASANAANIIPFFGGTIAWIYALVLNIIGLTETHKTDTWRSVAAVLLPIALCCICCVIVIVMIVGSAGIAATAGR